MRAELANSPAPIRWNRNFVLILPLLLALMLGLAAFYCGKEQVQAMLRDGDVIGRPPVRRAQLQ